MGKHRHWIGNGYTPVSLWLIFDKRGWDKTLKRFPVEERGEYPGEDYHASVCHYPAVKGYAHVSLMCVKPDYFKSMPKWRLAALVAHEAVHYMQRVQEIQGDHLDHETQAYIVQLVTLKAVEAIMKRYSR